MKEIVNTFYAGDCECQVTVQKAEYMVIRSDGVRQEAIFAESEEDVVSITLIWQIEPEVDYDVYELNEDGKYVPWKGTLEGTMEEKGDLVKRTIRKIRAMLKLWYAK